MAPSVFFRAWDRQNYISIAGVYILNKNPLLFPPIITLNYPFFSQWNLPNLIHFTLFSSISLQLIPSPSTPFPLLFISRFFPFSLFHSPITPVSHLMTFVKPLRTPHNPSYISPKLLFFLQTKFLISLPWWAVYVVCIPLHNCSGNIRPITPQDIFAAV